MNQMSIISDLLIWIENNIEKPLSIDHVAQKSGYSKWHLQRMFKETTGKILGTYIRHRRLTYAALALKLTSKPILDVAMQYRFDSQQTFTRSFKRQFNMTPALYRRSELWDTHGLMSSIALGKEPVAISNPILFYLDNHVFWSVSYKRRCNWKELLQGQDLSRQRFFKDYVQKYLKTEPDFPDRIFLFTEPKPIQNNPDEQEINYVVGVKGHKGVAGCQPFITIPGLYAAFKYKGSHCQFVDFVTQIYLDMLPNLDLKRRNAPSIEIVENCDKYLVCREQVEILQYIEGFYCVPVATENKDILRHVEGSAFLFDR